MRLSEAAAYTSGGSVRPFPDVATPIATYSTAGAVAALEWMFDGTDLAAVGVLPKETVP